MPAGLTRSCRHCCVGHMPITPKATGRPRRSSPPRARTPPPGRTIRWPSENCCVAESDECGHSVGMCWRRGVAHGVVSTNFWGFAMAGGLGCGRVQGLQRRSAQPCPDWAAHTSGVPPGLIGSTARGWCSGRTPKPDCVWIEPLTTRSTTGLRFHGRGYCQAIWYSRTPDMCRWQSATIWSSRLRTPAPQCGSVHWEIMW